MEDGGGAGDEFETTALERAGDSLGSMNRRIKVLIVPEFSPKSPVDENGQILTA